MMKKGIIAVSFMVFLLVLGCENLVRPETGKTGIPQGMGQVRLLLPAPQGRTLAPATPNFSEYKVSYQKRGGDNTWPTAWTLVSDEDVNASNPSERSVFLEAGTYKFQIEGYADAGNPPQKVLVASGATEERTLELDKEISIPVNLSPIKGSQNGTFTWRVTIPSGNQVRNSGFKFYDSVDIPNLYGTTPPAPKGLIIFKTDGRFIDWLHYKGTRPDSEARDPINTAVFIANAEDDSVAGMVTYSGSASLPAGEYFVTFAIHGYDYASGTTENGTRLAGDAQAVRIYSNLETPMAYTYGSDFFPNMVTISGSAAFQLNGASNPTTLIRLYKVTDTIDETTGQPVSTRTQIDEFNTLNNGFNRTVQADIGDVLEFDAMVEYQGSVFTKTLKLFPTSNTSLTITGNNTNVNLIDELNLASVEGSANAVYAGAEETMVLYYVNLKAYEDPQRQKLLNFGGLVKTGNPEVFESFIDGTFSLLLPTNITNYYFTVEADFGLENSANAIKLIKDLDAVQKGGDGKINLGNILFEGYQATLSGTLTGTLGTIVTNANWKNSIKSPAIAVYRDVNRTGKRLGKKDVTATAWDVPAFVPTYTEELYLLFEFKAGAAGSETTYRLPVGAKQPPATTSNIALSMDTVAPAAGVGYTIRGSIPIANIGQVVAYTPPTTGSYIVHAVAASGTSLAPTVAVYGQNGQVSVTNTNRFALTTGQTYLVLVKGGAGKVGSYDLSMALAPSTGGSGILQLEIPGDVQQAIDELFITTFVREYGDEVDEAIRIEFDPAYVLADFLKFNRGDNFDYIIDGNPLGDFVPNKPDPTVPEDFDYTPYRDPDGGATMTFSYEGWPQDSMHIISLRVVKDGIKYSRNWLVKIPVTQ